MIGEEIVVSLWQWLIKGVRDSFIPIILSTVISLSANKIFVQRHQRKRRHSITINDESFDEWRMRINELCLIGGHTPLSVYSHDQNKIIPIELKELDQIEHHKYLESHMKTGYPKTWKLWNQLRENTIEYLKHLAEVLESIRTQIIEESSHQQLKEYYYKPGKKTPNSYFKPDKIATQIYKELNNRLDGMDEWMQGMPKSAFYMSGEDKLYNLSLTNDSNIVHDYNELSIPFFIELILRYVQNEEYMDAVKKLRNMSDDIMVKRDVFIEDLDDVISEIQLGHNVKGKCDSC